MQKKHITLLSAVLLLFISSGNTFAQSQNDLVLIKQSVVSDLMAGPVNNPSVGQMVKTIRQDGTWPGIDYVDTSKTGFQHKDHLENMLTLARAYKKRGGPYYQSQDVKNTFSRALDFWLAKDFRCANWWWNEMGTPNFMINILLVMDSSLTAKQRLEGYQIAHRANMETFGARPGGDLMPIAGMVAKQGLFLMNADTLAKAMTAMQADIKISTGRGLKPDMSFHHRTDNVISTLTYGSNYASSFAYWGAKTKGTRHVFPARQLQLVVDYFLDGICQSLVYRAWPDPGAMNRDISRRNALDKEDISLPQNLLAATNSQYRADELQQVTDVRTGKKNPDFTRDRYFRYSHYYTHQRPDYFASMRMHSSRANNMEEPHNEEGIKNHHYGDGSFFISRTAQEYFNIFPVWDWQKIPGATILQKPEMPHWRQLAKKGKTDFSGGASDGRYGVAAFDFVSVHDPLKARKSWFFFDDEIVCLGAGIHTDAAASVFTTLNQCLLKGTVNVGVNGRKMNLQPGKYNLENVSWVCHDSVAYIFPKPAKVNISEGEATGSWKSISHQSSASDAVIRENVFTLWLDHGVQPQNADYAWIVVPGLDAPAAADYSKKQRIRVLVNTEEVQAVQHPGLQRTGIVFYKAGSLKIDDKLTLTASAPCVVMVKKGGDIAVADPTQKLGSLQLKLNDRVIDVTLPAGDQAGSTVIVK